MTRLLIPAFTEEELLYPTSEHLPSRLPQWTAKTMEVPRANHMPIRVFARAYKYPGHPSLRYRLVRRSRVHWIS